MIGGRRFLGQDIQPGAGDEAGFEGVLQGRFIHQSAATGVDEAGPGEHGFEMPALQQAPAAGRHGQPCEPGAVVAPKPEMT